MFKKFNNLGILRKIKVGALVALLIQGIRQFFPEVPIPDNLDDSITLVYKGSLMIADGLSVLVPFVVAFFVKEDKKNLRKLETRS